MRYFPLFLDTLNKNIIVAGGDEQATQKVRLLLKTNAKITVIAPRLSEELLSYLKDSRINHVPAVFDQKLTQNADFIFAASPCVGVNGMFALSAHTLTKVNVVDSPSLSNAITPSIVDRNPIVVAVGSEGNSPTLARKIKSMIEMSLEDSIGEFAKTCQILKAQINNYIKPQYRKDFWDWVVSSTPRKLWKQKKYKQAKLSIINASKNLHNINIKSKTISIIKVCKNIDMMPIRSVQKMQNADIIIFDQNIHQNILEYPRRDARRKKIKNQLNQLHQAILKTYSEYPDYQNIVCLSSLKDEKIKSLLEIITDDNTEAELISCACDSYSYKKGSSAKSAV